MKNQNNPCASFLFLSANTPWVYSLATSLAQTYPTHVVQFYDWRTVQARHGWPSTPNGLQLKRTLVSLPPGYAGRFEWISRPFLQRAIKTWYHRLNDRGAPPWVIVPYPFLAPWVRPIADSKLVYYNLDDYTLYDLSKAARTTCLEDELVSRSAVTICLSKCQRDQIRARHPGRKKDVIHFPLGVNESLINPKAEMSPWPNTVGYVGNLIDRVDWKLVTSVARRCPEYVFYFVGAVTTAGSETATDVWKKHRTEALSLPNVKQVGPIPQEEVNQYYWSFAVNWIPYDIHHPFNIASCPTKIMDTISTGRPVLSTSVPECLLHPEYIRIADDPEASADAIRDLMGNHVCSAKAQLDFARCNTWHNRAHQLMELLKNE